MRLLAATLIMVFLDQVVKSWLLTVDFLPFWLIQDQVGLVLTRNPGIAFSIPLTGMASIVVSVLVMAGLFWFYRTSVKTSWLSDLIFALIFGGAFGNLLDRIFRGAVIDFLQVYSWPVFNLADAAITSGCLLMILFFSRVVREDRQS